MYEAYRYHVIHAVIKSEGTIFDAWLVNSMYTNKCIDMLTNDHIQIGNQAFTLKAIRSRANLLTYKVAVTQFAVYSQRLIYIMICSAPKVLL